MSTASTCALDSDDRLAPLACRPRSRTLQSRSWCVPVLPCSRAVAFWKADSTRRAFLSLSQRGFLAYPSPAVALKDKKTRKLFRAGLPPAIRGEVWMFFSEANARRTPGQWDKLLDEAETTDDMEQDVSQCVPNPLRCSLARLRMLTRIAALSQCVPRPRALQRAVRWPARPARRHPLLRQVQQPPPVPATCASLLGRFAPAQAVLTPFIALWTALVPIAGVALLQVSPEESFYLVAAMSDRLKGYFDKALQIDALVFVYLLEATDKNLARRLVVSAGPLTASASSFRR